MKILNDYKFYDNAEKNGKNELPNKVWHIQNCCEAIFEFL